jgi:hypothetical protein
MHVVTIRIKGEMDQSWSEWFEGFNIEHLEPDETLLTGLVEDQAAFYGLIGKLRDLGVQLAAVNSTALPDQETTLEG